MPKPILFDADAPRRKKKKRKKRKVDYTALLNPPTEVSARCPHTKRVQDATSCSQCMLVQPSIVHKPVTKDWWAEDPEIEISLENIANALGGTIPIELEETDGFLDVTPDED